tara:strand:- start:1118 stop:1402 length:285 start_codon:yes stop_codon:yes gene_type:complete
MTMIKPRTLSLLTDDEKARHHESSFVYHTLAPLFRRLANGFRDFGDGECGLINTRRTIYEDLCARVLQEHVVHFLPHNVNINQLRDNIWKEERT